jgi:adenylate cyclase
VRVLRWLTRVSAFRLALWIGAAFAGLQFYAGILGKEIPVLSRLDSVLYDAKFILRGTRRQTDGEKRAKHVVIAAGDETTIKDFGRFPWPRRVYAAVIDNVVADGAAAIAFDASMSDDVEGELPALSALRQRYRDAKLAPADLRPAAETDDEILARSVAAAKDRVVLGYIYYPVGGKELPDTERSLRGIKLLDRNALGPVSTEVAEASGVAVRRTADAVKGRGSLRDVVPDAPVAPLAAVAERLGYFNVEADPDGVIRRVPLVAWVAGKPVPSLELATLAATQGVPADWITPVSDNPAAAELSRIDIAGTKISIPVEKNGSMLVNFDGGDGSFQAVPISHIASGRFAPGTFKDRVVLVGVTAMGTHDHRVTPFEKFSPGVEVHANAIENIITGQTLSRPYWAPGLEFLLLLAIAAGLGFLFSRVDARIAFAAYASAGVGYFLFDYALFRSGYVVVSALPQLQLLATFVATTSYRYLTETREKQKVRRTFQFYLDEAVMQEMLEAPDRLRLGGEKRELTVVFSDIRGFTTISEQLAPEALVTLLNEYLTPMTGVVFRNGGTLDKYMGDAIMCFFGAPMEQKDHALRACRTALQMIEELERLREWWRAESRPEIDIGIGINSGPMVVGNMGSDMRFDYTVMGDNVNLGSRLEGINKEYGTRIILSEFTLEAVKGEVAVRELGAVRVKGKKRPVKIFELLALGAPPPELQPFLDAFARGLALRFPERRFEEAALAFREALALRPDDVASAKYVAECEACAGSPPPAAWDGVLEMKTK